MSAKKTAGVALLIATITGLGSCERPEPEVQATPEVRTFSNPVIAGFAPDPSVVRVGNDFYLVNSTFEYFPGLPVYHSRDLVNWSLIGHALHDLSQVDLANVDSSGGVHAPTIRYHNGTFYVIVTNIVDNEPLNFIVTADDPRGPWSQPYVLDDAPGIDPSLFFDDDGSVWYSGNRMPPDPEFPGQAEIWLQQLDLDSMQLVGDKHYLWRGCCQGVRAEGPHVYKRDGHYYLLLSEGGTSYEHALSIAISDEITGPYRNNPRNPILTHRQLSYDYPITGVGHADLVELQDGRWYAVALGWRLVDGKHGILGRETFLAPVSWETEPYEWKEDKLTFPVVSPATGRIELRYPVPFDGTEQQPETAFIDDFNDTTLGPEWNFRRSYVRPFYTLTAAPGILRMDLQPGFISKRTRYSFAGIRQRHFRFEATTAMRFRPENPNEEAGLVVIQNDRAAYLLTLTRGDTSNRLQLYGLFNEERMPVASQDFPGDSVHLRVDGDYLRYSFGYSADGDTWTTLANDVDGTALSPAVIGGFNYTGVYIGLYATSNGAGAASHADFGSFRYRPIDADRTKWFQRQAERMK